MKEHTNKRFEDELNELKNKILAMGGLVEKATRRSINSLVKHDAKRAHKVIERDHAINALEVEIDEMTRTMLALRQPAASDLRLIMTTIKVVTDLERMGDLAEGIAEYMLQTEEHPVIQISSLESLADHVLQQVNDALDAFARRDLVEALACIEKDKKIDAEFKSMQREYLTYMMEDPRQITAGLLSTNIARNLERIGDHAVNIAEMVIYMIKGHDIRHVDHETAAAIVSGRLNEGV
ncbi:phosphate transport system protein [Mariprofundus ferrinatatus]|uniref:Phosphate-specific transport system accessory protein PhoU n=1 Tax=Mariprofundus ferrinatatus TaxID=1921087 RepID=A0A2K8L2F8_9PROT|nr:phosphate signaling complex protein PhoU [Mariprofundus ferrinatatus]ATX81505.1 phosphate transport system protein [Mariprofundus ferrinatatus]